MNFLLYIQALTYGIMFLTEKSGNFRLGAYDITVLDVPGKPVHLTLGQAISAVEKALLGQVGTFQIGDVSISIAPWVTPAPPTP